MVGGCVKRAQRPKSFPGDGEDGNGEQNHKQGDARQPTRIMEPQRKEYILFITDGAKEIEAAANYLSEELSRAPRPEDGLELVVQSVPNFDTAIKFWEEHMWVTPLIVSDKRRPDSTGSVFKLVHSDVDHEIFTGVIDAYTERTPEGGARKLERINPRTLAQTILNIELKEMRRYRMPLVNLNAEQLDIRAQERRRRIGEAVVAYRDTQLGITPELAIPEARLSAVVGILRQHYGKQDSTSLRRVALAGKQLDYLLKELPPGLAYVTHSSKEGVFGLQTVLEGGDEKAPIFAIKRFKELAQAQHVNWLSEQLWLQREGKQENVTFLNTPKTYWPLKVDGYSVVFMDVIVGENLITLMPKINSHIRQKREGQEPDSATEAEMLKDFILRATLDNVAYWQHVAPAFAQSIGYQPQPEQIQSFINNTLLRSSEVLEALTGITLSRRSIESAATAASSATSLRHAIGLDSGPRNILVTEKAPGCSVDELIADLKGYETSVTGRRSALNSSNVADAIFQVDIPYELRTVHQLRDFVRLAYAPSNELEQNEINRLFAYWLLRGERLNATTPQERASVMEDIYSIVNRTREPQRLTIVSKYLDDSPYDLEIAAVAEAARMSVVIPLVFMSKANTQLLGELPASMSRSELNAKFEELVNYNREWAQVGLTAASQLEGKLEGDRKYEIQGAIRLFEEWKKAVVDQKRLLTFTPFMSI